MYSDNAPELVRAAHERAWVHERAIPGISKNNGLVESQEGTRCLLLQAGLDPRWWPHAARCFCHMNNVQKKDGMSPWLRRFESKDFDGELIPFGALIDFLQQPMKETIQTKQAKYAPRTVTGIFLGYFLQPGGKWKGDYLCISLAFLRDGQATAVQRVATITPPPSKVYRCPLAEEKDPYSDQWRFSHGLLGTESGGGSPASKFPYKDDTS
eukprot:5826210-Amphidinium_carterae.1